MKNLEDIKIRSKTFIENHMFILSILVLASIYYGIVRRFLIPSMSTVIIELLLAGITLVVLVYSTVTLIITGLITGLKSLSQSNKDQVKSWKKRFFKKLRLVLTSFSFLVLITVISQYIAYTPPILDWEGNKVENSIATLEKITINDSEQYITKIIL